MGRNAVYLVFCLAVVNRALSLKCYQCVAENEKDQCATNATAVTSIDCKDAIIPPGLPRDKMVCVTRMEADISGETNTFKALQRMCSVDPAALAQGGVSGTSPNPSYIYEKGATQAALYTCKTDNCNAEFYTDPGRPPKDLECITCNSTSKDSACWKNPTDDSIPRQKCSDDSSGCQSSYMNNSMQALCLGTYNAFLHIDCGYVGITEDECVEKKCCWAPCSGSDCNINTPWCFRNKNGIQMVRRGCDVYVGDKTCVETPFQSCAYFCQSNSNCNDEVFAADGSVVEDTTSVTTNATDVSGAEKVRLCLGLLVIAIVIL